MNRYKLDKPKPIIYAWGFGGLSLAAMNKHKAKGSSVDVIFAPLHEANMKDHMGIQVPGLPASFKFIPYDGGGIYKIKSITPQAVYDYLNYHNFVFVEEL
jgi:hypothetical protein